MLNKLPSKPWLQWLIVMAATLVSLLITKLLTTNTETHWLVIITGLLFFGMVNPILSVFHHEHLKYSLISVGLLWLGILFFLMLGKLGLTSSWKVYPSYQIMIGVIIVIHLIALVCAKLLKSIYAFTRRESGQSEYFD